MKRGKKLKITKEDIDHPYAKGQVVFFVEDLNREGLIWVRDVDDNMSLIAKDEYEEA